MTTHPRAHCGHECVCWMYIEQKIPEKKIPCPRNSGGVWSTCTKDTRRQPQPDALLDEVEKRMVEIANEHIGQDGGYYWSVDLERIKEEFAAIRREREQR